MAVGLFVIIFSLIKFVFGKEEGFIVGGDFVRNIKQFPHVAFLELTSRTGDDYICGSSILNQVILITAAHCLDNITAIKAHVGSTNRDQGEVYQVASFEQHSRWDGKGDSLRHDIGLCKLQRPLQFGRTVKRVLLMRNPPKTRFADLAGWGAIEEKDYTDSIMLKHTVQKLWDRKKCRNVLYQLPKGTICGGETHSKDFASKGDSGSGLLVQNKIMVGLVSYKDVTISRSLVVYTDVAHYYNWILKTSRRLSCS